MKMFILCIEYLTGTFAFLIEVASRGYEYIGVVKTDLSNIVVTSITSRMIFERKVLTD